jgi:hypothetical protein
MVLAWVVGIPFRQFLDVLEPWGRRLRGAHLQHWGALHYVGAATGFQCATRINGLCRPSQDKSIQGKAVPPSFLCPVSMEVMVSGGTSCSFVDGRLLCRRCRSCECRTPFLHARPATTLPQVDPVILATGHTYDRSSIERWLEQGHKTCPVTGMRLRHLELTPNFALRSAIQVGSRGWLLCHRGCFCHCGLHRGHCRSWSSCCRLGLSTGCTAEALAMDPSAMRALRRAGLGASQQCGAP